MALNLEIITPDEVIFSGEVAMVNLSTAKVAFSKTFFVALLAIVIVAG